MPVTSSDVLLFIQHNNFIIVHFQRIFKML